MRIACALLLLCGIAWGGVKPDETPPNAEEWGFRPAAGAVSELNPPRFCWRPQKEAASYIVEASRDGTFARVEYRAEKITFNVHAPAQVFEPGRWHWRFAFVDAQGKQSEWSVERAFTIPPDAMKFPIPPRPELLARIPKAHPRMFVRPEQMDELRRKARGELAPIYAQLTEDCEKRLKKPVSTKEPPTYPPGTVSHSEQWREIWGGNMKLVPQIMTPAVSLGFAYQLSGDKRFGNEAKRILLEVARWDPHGATGYLYNDEAGMPYNYLFSRAYSFVQELMTEDERKLCREVMRIRGKEMYEHLCPDHLWKPYGSHRNRAWHFLGEVAVAFHGEIPEADDWLWFAMNVFACVYPVWNDADGGWHEGMAYWRSYMDRFTWWADIMKASMDIDAYRLPFFSQVGYYAMYAMPPGTMRGGFGDQTTAIDSIGNVKLMSVFAAQAQNPYWEWYVEAQGGQSAADGGGGGGAGYLAFLRAAYPRVQPKPPADLPSSRCFRGTGLAFLNSNLLDAKQNVQINFKSSPFGTQSHGYTSQNAFELYVFGKPLLIQSGQRDIYGSDHHSNWMWETKSVNSILVGGRGQVKHSPTAVGRITQFEATPKADYVQGDASAAYDPPLKRFTRSILFLKPDVIVTLDRVSTGDAQKFQWMLHAPTEMKISAQDDVRVKNGEAACRISFLAPTRLKLTQTDKFDPPPRPRLQLREFHLTTETAEPSADVTFVTVLQPHRAGEAVPDAPKMEPAEGGWIVRTRRGDVRVRQNGERDLAPLGDDIQRHTLKSEYQPGEQTVYVLPPAVMNPGERYRVLYVLPVYAGAKPARAAIDEARKLDLHNRYNVILASPAFEKIPWYADHASDPLVRQESHFIKAALPFVESHYPAIADASGRLVVGYSKSGWGALTLLLRNPQVFGRAGSWDAPLTMREIGKYGTSDVMGTQENFDRYSVPRLIEQRADVFKSSPARLFIMGHGYFQEDDIRLHEQLARLGIQHFWAHGPERKHAWDSGWLDPLVAAMMHPD